MTEDDVLKQRIEVWKTIVGTQQHFNNLQIQLRNFSLTLFTAVFTIVGFAIKEHVKVVGQCVSVAGIIVLVAFYYMDWGYHQLLKGSVNAGIDIEPSLKDFFQGPGLGVRISEASKATKFLGFVGTDSTGRLTIFYVTQFVVLACVALFVFFFYPDQQTTEFSAPSAAILTSGTAGGTSVYLTIPPGQTSTGVGAAVVRTGTN